MNGDKPHNKEIAKFQEFQHIEALLTIDILRRKVKDLDDKEKILKEWVDECYKETYDVCCNYAEGQALAYTKVLEFIKNDYKEIDNG